jgi:hypothetical protein
MAGRCSRERRLNRSMAANTATSAGFAARHDAKGFLQTCGEHFESLLPSKSIGDDHPRDGGADNILT